MRRLLIAIAVFMGLSVALAVSSFALASARGVDVAAASVVDSPAVELDQEPVVAEVREESTISQPPDQVAVNVAHSSAKKGAYEKGAYEGIHDGAFCPFKDGGEF